MVSNLKTMSDEEFSRNIRYNLEIIRTNKTNLSQKDFAKKIRMSESHYKRLIRGDAEIGAAYSFREIYLIGGMCLYELAGITDPCLALRSKIGLLDKEQLAFIESIVDREIENSKEPTL